MSLTLPPAGSGRDLLFGRIDRLRKEANDRGEKFPTDAELARTVFGVAPGSFSAWRSGDARPAFVKWPLIEAWSDGEVPMRAWDTAKERDLWLAQEARTTPSDRETAPPPAV